MASNGIKLNGLKALNRADEVDDVSSEEIPK